MMTPKRETPQAIEERGTVEAKYARLFFLPVLRGTVLIVALCASVPFLAGLLFEVYGGRWETAGIVYVLASFTLIAMIPKPDVSDHLNLLFSERAPDVVLIRRYPRQGKSSTNRPWRRQLAQKSWSEDRCGAPTRTPLGDLFAGLVIGREP